jgi:putative transposase
MSNQSRPWRHQPLHIFAPNSFYIITASTLYKQNFFKGNNRLQMLCDALFEVSETYGWLLQAWAVFTNHYHFIARSPKNATTLKAMIQRLHSQTAREVNRLDNMKSRQVWFQYGDTCLTYENSYYARLNYVHNNPVKHSLVQIAEQYPFCSALWFKTQTDPVFRKKVESFRYERINIIDDF